jgi:hypothetical protein
VRRRVFEPQPQPPPREPGAVAPRHVASTASEVDEDLDGGPPSSVNVARALASLRADELHRLERILSDNDDEERAAAIAAARRSVPTVRIGPTIPVSELARRMSVSAEELVTALVTRGFFSVTVKASLARETARAAAALFGWEVEEADESETAPVATKQAKAKPVKGRPSKKAPKKTSRSSRKR